MSIEWLLSRDLRNCRRDLSSRSMALSVGLVCLIGRQWLVPACLGGCLFAESFPIERPTPTVVARPSNDDHAPSVGTAHRPPQRIEPTAAIAPGWKSHRERSVSGLAFYWPQQDSSPPGESPEESPPQEPTRESNTSESDEAGLGAMTESEEDAELLERVRVGDGSPLDQAFEEFDQALEDMRSAQRRLKAEDTGDGTRKSQSRAANRLEEILKLLQQPPPPSSSSSSEQQSGGKQQQQQGQQGQQGQQRQQGQAQGGGRNARARGRSRSRGAAAGQRRQRQEGLQQRLAQARPRPANAKPGSQDQAPGESQAAQNPTGGEERHDQVPPKSEEATKRRSDANDVWGHLPPTVRETLQKSFNERYLPKYEELVRRYYESLAEKRRDSR